MLGGWETRSVEATGYWGGGGGGGVFLTLRSIL